MKKYVIMGVQGSGKGTQAKRLCDDYDLVHISVGDIFRWHIQAHTKLGAKVRRGIEGGNLVEDDIVQEVVSERLEEHDWNYGFVLDGFPRNKAQAVFFIEKYDIDAVIHLDVSDDVVMKRVLSRRLCSKCGLDYNLFYHRPKVDGVCDVCGGRLVQRADDNEAAVRKRMKDYHEGTEPAIAVMGKKEQVIKVDASKDSAEVQRLIREGLGI
ncbi:adenylate kinase family protein [Poriferisphaera sp. WC338]|uniref:adenylate kinase family protein n=1 Tax=Poriferisphaera sp. WC338 TaxID=3425129 RepID=UPI003D81BF38